VSKLSAIPGSGLVRKGKTGSLTCSRAQLGGQSQAARSLSRPYSLAIKGKPRSRLYRARGGRVSATPSLIGYATFQQLSDGGFRYCDILATNWCLSVRPLSASVDDEGRFRRDRSAALVASSMPTPRGQEAPGCEIWLAGQRTRRVAVIDDWGKINPTQKVGLNTGAAYTGMVQRRNHTP
jgi:hypothetical protein